MVRKGGLEPPCLSAPPPQDGVSANFTTSARWALRAETAPIWARGNLRGILIITEQLGLTDRAHARLKHRKWLFRLNLTSYSCVSLRERGVVTTFVESRNHD